MNRLSRLAATAIVVISVVVGIANPAAAVTPEASGEVLSSYGTDCGVLRIDPSTPAFGENITVSLTGAKPNAEIPIHLALGIYKNGRWFPLADEADGRDGQVDLAANTLVNHGLTTDANGEAIETGTLGQLTYGYSGTLAWYFNLFMTLLPTFWVVQCDAGVSFAQVRGARASLSGSLALDPLTPGAIVGSGMPADTMLTGILVDMADYPDPGIASWRGLVKSDLGVGGFHERTDALGNLTSSTLFADLGPGRYALGVVGGLLSTSPPNLFKAEYVVTVAEDLTVSMALWADPPADGIADARISLAAALGEPVAGSTVNFRAKSLEPYSNWSVAVHSTPQALAHGVVGMSGILSGSTAIPAGLEAGWHTLTLAATDSTGSSAEADYWFKIGDAGELLQVSDTEPAADVVAAPAMLAATGVDGLGLIGVSGGALALGLALALLARRRGAIELSP